MEKQRVHFTESYLLTPTNPVTLNVIGAGGTGSQVLSALVRIQESLTMLGHPGLSVRVFDDDIITNANRGRQLYAKSEVGLPKAVALVNKINRFLGTSWKAFNCLYNHQFCSQQADNAAANITISCVDTAKARFEIADILKGLAQDKKNHACQPYYWLDYGNSRHTGQAVLATVSNIPQGASNKYATVPTLPMVTDEFGELLQQAGTEDDTPSCSLAEALTKQDLFINPALADIGGELLWKLFREGMLAYRGFFLNLQNFRMQPILI